MSTLQNGFMAAGGLSSTGVTTVASLLGLSGKMVYVDSVNGSNSTGARGTSKPFLTIAAARTAASSGDLVIIGPGNWSGETTLTPKSGVVFYKTPNALNVDADLLAVGFPAITHVADNAAKLALSNVNIGDEVIIDGEALRREVFRGGHLVGPTYTAGPSSANENWELRGPNTFLVYVGTNWDDNAPTINGVEASSDGHCGWAREGEAISYIQPNPTATLTVRGYALVGDPGGGAVNETPGVDIPVIPSQNSTSFLLPVAPPLRGAIRLEYIQTS